MKRFLALVLSCVMLLTLCPTAWAVEATATDVAVGADDSVRPEEPVLTAPTLGAEPYTGTLGANVTWSLDRETGVLTISGTGAMGNYSSETSPLWNYRSYIKTAVINSGVTTVGECVFDGCTNLTTVTIPAGVTTIGYDAFYNCDGLTSVTIPDSVTSIGRDAFFHCDGLTSVTIGSGVTTIGIYAFKDCRRLTSVTIPDSVTDIGYNAFSACSSLTSVTIGSGVTSVGAWAFGACSKLTRVNITDLAAWCGISFGDDCANPLYYAAASLYLNGELVTDLVIPGTVSAIGQYAFYNCTSITSVYVPQSVKSIGEYAFYGNTGLQTVRYASSQDDWLKIQIGSYNDSLTALTPAFNESIEGYCRITAQAGDHGTVAFDNSLVKKGGTVTIRAIPEAGYAVETYLVNGQPIEGNTFTAQTDSTVVSATFVKIYDVVDGGAGDCGASVKWVLDKKGTLHIYGSGAMYNYYLSAGRPTSPFYEYRRYIKSVVVDKNVTSISNYAFYQCNNLITVEFLGNAPTLGSSAFYGCAPSFIILYHGGTTGWTSPTWNGYKAACNDPISPSAYTTLDENNRNGQGIYFALNSVSLTATVGKNTTADNNSGYYGGQDGAVVIPDTVTKGGVEYQVIGINQYAFANFHRVTSVAIGRYVSAIEPSAFQGCSGLTGFTVDKNNLQYAAPGGVLFDKESLYLYVYPAGKPGTAYEIPASCDTIGAKAFYGAKNLTEITVPVTVNNIGAMAFSGCDGLTEVTLPFIGGNAKDTNQFNYVFGSDGYSSYGGVPANLKKVTVLTANLTDRAFYNCVNIEEIYLPDCTELTSIPDSCFCNCNALTRVAFGNQTTAGVAIPDSVKLIGNSAFSQCTAMTAVTIGDQVESIGSYAFNGCTGLTTVYIGKGVQMIWTYVFSGCFNLEKYVVAEDNADFTADQWGVLYSKDMSKLFYYPAARLWPYYNVSDKTTTLSTDAFVGCTHLVNLYIPKAVTTFNSNCITNCPGMTMCCYKGSAAAGYAISHSLTAWYMDNYKMQGLNITSLPEMLTYSVQGALLNAPYVTATYGDKELQVDDYQLTLQKAYGQQTVTVTSGGKSKSFETTVLRTGDINGNSKMENGIVTTRVDVTDMACLYDYTSTGVNTGDIEDEDYFAAVADVNGDGYINILDYQRLYEMVRNG